MLLGITGYRMFGPAGEGASAVSQPDYRAWQNDSRWNPPSPTSDADGRSATASSDTASTPSSALPRPSPAPVRRKPYHRAAASPGQVANPQPPPPPPLNLAKQTQSAQGSAPVTAASATSGDSDRVGGAQDHPVGQDAVGARGMEKSLLPQSDAAPAETATVATADHENRPERWVKAVGHFFHIGSRKYVPPPETDH